MRPTPLMLLAIAALSLPAAAAADSRTPGFQLQADGLVYSPIGKLNSQAHASLSDLFGTGSGFAITATIGLTPHWCAGVRVASSRSSGTGSHEFTDMGIPVGSERAEGSGPYAIERELKLVPVQAVVQYRRSLGPHAEWTADAGAGVLSTIGHLTLRSTSGARLASIAGYQKDPAWTIGTSIGWQIPLNLEAVASARYCGALSQDGAVWVKGDDPGFADWSLGLRYPHDTR